MRPASDNGGPRRSNPGGPSEIPEPLFAQPAKAKAKSEQPTVVTGAGFTQPDSQQNEDTGVAPTLVAPEATPAATLMAQPTSPASKDEPPSGSQLLAGRFEILSELGEGGMGRVFGVRDRQIEGRQVALKLLRPQFSQNRAFRELFFQEIRAAQSFVSENVVQVRDTGQMEDGQLFLTMDMVEGESLFALLAREHSLSVRHALEIARQALLGLQSGHEQGFIHRDIKPSNVMLAGRVPKTDDNPFGVHVKILDFGLAGVAAEVDDGRIAGTPMYMSPEQAQGHRLDPRSDLFAVGVVLYEMLAGSRPFEGKTIQEITTSVIETNVSPLIGQLDHLSRPIQKILKRALQKDRDKRFQSAAEFVKAIESSKAYTLPKGTPFWVAASLGVISVAGGIAGTVAWKLYGDTIQLNDDLNAAGVAQNAAVARVEQEKNVQIASLNATIHELTSQLEAAQNEDIEGVDERIDVESEKLSLEQKIATLTTSLQNVEARLTSTDEQRRKAEARADRFERELDEAKGRLQELTQTTQPPAIMATGFDRIVTFIERGNGELALGELQSLVKRQVFDQENLHGREFVFGLANAADCFDRFEKKLESGEGVDIPLLHEARQHLDLTEDLSGSFELAAADWLNEELADGQPNRLEKTALTLSFLRTRIDGAFSSLGKMDDESWAPIAERHAIDPGRDPEAAFAHFAQHGFKHLAELEKGFIAYLDGELDRSGTLNADALEAFEALDDWGAFYGDRPAEERSEEAERILLYWYARHWFGEGELAGDLARNPMRIPALANDEPQSNWPAQMALQMALARPGSAFPTPSGSELVYQFRSLESSAGDTSWWVESTSSGAEAGAAWDIERKIFYQDPSRRPPPISIEVTRSGNNFYQRGVDILNLTRLSEDVRVASWTPPFDDLVSGMHWGPSGDEVAEFQSELVKAPARCLVVRKGTFTRWFSPEYGLVREENDDVSVRELVYARIVR